MLGLVEKGWSRLRGRWTSKKSGDSAVGDAASDISDRIRARYDTARRETKKPTRRWLQQQGVMEDWSDAWKAVDRW